MELKRILIVEDDADIAAIERDYLELGGYAVTIAPDGTTGLDAALHQPFDLILLDVMLPGIDGFAICKQVRAEKDIPILIPEVRDYYAGRSCHGGSGRQCIPEASDCPSAPLLAGSKRTASDCCPERLLVPIRSYAGLCYRCNDPDRSG